MDTCARAPHRVQGQLLQHAGPAPLRRRPACLTLPEIGGHVPLFGARPASCGETWDVNQNSEQTTTRNRHLRCWWCRRQCAGRETSPYAKVFDFRFSARVTQSRVYERVLRVSQLRPPASELRRPKSELYGIYIILRESRDALLNLKLLKGRADSIANEHSIPFGPCLVGWIDDGRGRSRGTLPSKVGAQEQRNRSRAAEQCASPARSPRHPAAGVHMPEAPPTSARRTSGFRSAPSGDKSSNSHPLLPM